MTLDAPLSDQPLSCAKLFQSVCENDEAATYFSESCEDTICQLCIEALIETIDEKKHDDFCCADPVQVCINGLKAPCPRFHSVLVCFNRMQCPAVFLRWFLLKLILE